MDEFTGRGTPVTAAAFDAATGRLGAAKEALWAVIAVETSGFGYLRDRRPQILFERHHFHRLTHGTYDAAAPDVSQPSQGGYGKRGAHQYERLAVALALDRQAALMSASWGLGQIMGENHQVAGYGDVEAMVKAFVASEDSQLAGMAGFIDSGPCRAALQTQDWATFARNYNGPTYAQNDYDGKLKAARDKFAASQGPDLRVRQAQAWLNYLGKDTGGVDGVAGGKTTAALKAFQAAQGLPADGVITDATLAALAAA